MKVSSLILSLTSVCLVAVQANPESSPNENNVLTERSYYRRCATRGGGCAYNSCCKGLSCDSRTKTCRIALNYRCRIDSDCCNTNTCQRGICRPKPKPKCLRSYGNSCNANSLTNCCKEGKCEGGRCRVERGKKCRWNSDCCSGDTCQKGKCQARPKPSYPSNPGYPSNPSAPTCSKVLGESCTKTTTGLRARHVTTSTCCKIGTCGDNNKCCIARGASYTLATGCKTDGDCCTSGDKCDTTKGICSAPIVNPPAGCSSRDLTVGDVCFDGPTAGAPTSPIKCCQAGLSCLGVGFAGSNFCCIQRESTVRCKEASDCCTKDDVCRPDGTCGTPLLITDPGPTCPSTPIAAGASCKGQDTCCATGLECSGEDAQNKKCCLITGSSGCTKNEECCNKDDVCRTDRTCGTPELIVDPGPTCPATPIAAGLSCKDKETCCASTLECGGDDAANKKCCLATSKSGCSKKEDCCSSEDVCRTDGTCGAAEPTCAAEDSPCTKSEDCCSDEEELICRTDKTCGPPPPLDPIPDPCETTAIWCCEQFGSARTYSSDMSSVGATIPQNLNMMVGIECASILNLAQAPTYRCPSQFTQVCCTGANTNGVVQNCGTNSQSISIAPPGS